MLMNQQTETAGFPAFAQKLIDRGKSEGIAEGKREGIAEGVAKGKRETLLRLLTRAGIAFSEDDRARVLACSDADTLDRWIDNVLTAKTIADVLS
jgi:predicted transposase YdaD